MRPRHAAVLPALLLAACAIAQEPDEAVARSNELRRTAFVAQNEGRHEAAAESFLELCDLEPQNADWVIRAADNLGRSGRFNDAMDLLERAGEKFPDVLEIRATLARTFHMKADAMRADGVFDANVLFYYQDTIRVAEQVLSHDAAHFQARLLIASAHYQIGEVDRAIEEAEEVVRQHPREHGGHALIGKIAFDRFVKAIQDGDEEARTKWAARAVEAFERAHSTDPTRAMPMVKLGDIQAWSGDMDAALERYEEAMVIDPHANVDHDWLRGRLDAEQRTVFYTRALATYSERDDAAESGKATILWYLSQARFDAKDYAVAATGFTLALEALPDFQTTWWWLMQSQYWAGDEEAAQQSAVGFSRAAPRRFADMIRADDQTVALIVGMAGRAYSSGRAADSRDLNRVIAYARQTADAWNNYAFLCRETRKFEESLRAYQEALSLEPESPQLLNDAAVILQYHLRSDENRARARQMYERAIALAEQQLADGSLGDSELKRTRTALRDARANLAKMR